jgi:hypothetical protein
MVDASRGLAAARAGLVAVCTLLSTLEGQAQESACDKNLEKLAGGPHGYVLRGDRCEGIYAREVAGTSLWIASLTESFEDYKLASDTDLVIEWAAPGDRSIRLRAQGVRHDLFYRMDAVRPASPSTYRWPTDLLAAQHIPREDIGVLGWTSHPVGGVDRDLYVPLRIRRRQSTSKSIDYNLVLFPTEELAEVYVSLATVGADGQPKKFIRQGKPLRYGYYGAESPVSISLPELKDPGIYYLEIGADLATGGSATLTSWIYRGP